MTQNDGMVCDLLFTLAPIFMLAHLEPRVTDEPSEEKALMRLAVTYGILRRLGFSEERVEECLRAIPGVDLDEAYEWVGRQVYPSSSQLTHFFAARDTLPGG